MILHDDAFLRRSLESIDWQTICEALATHCRTEEGRHMALHLLPERNFQAIAEPVLWSEAFGALDETGLGMDLSVCDQIRLFLARVTEGDVLEAHEFLHVGEFLDRLDHVHRLTLETQKLGHAMAHFLPHQQYWDTMRKAISERISSHGEIRWDASPRLSDLSREEWADRARIEKSLDDTIQRYGYQEMLMERYVTLRDGRYVLPVKMQFHNQVNGVMHDLSNTKQTAFIEPFEIVQINNHLIGVLEAKEDERFKILRFLTEQITSRMDQVRCDLGQLHLVDVIRAKLTLGRQWRGILIPPGHDDAWQGMILKELRHPLLVLQGATVVANSVLLSSNERGLVVSGPNMGGKTILLKSVGAAVVLCYCGIPVPCAPESRIPCFAWMRLVIGDQQSIAEGISSFAFQIEMIKDVPPTEGLGLVVIDEMMAATDPEEGEVLAQALLATWVKHPNMVALVSTHFGRIKSLSVTGHYPFGFGSMAYEKGKPTYHFLAGSMGQSFGIETAKTCGMPAHIIAEAKRLLGHEKMAMNDLVQVLQKRVSEHETGLLAVEEQRKMLDEKSQSIEAERHELTSAREKLKVSVLHEVWQDYEATLKSMRAWLSGTNKSKKSLAELELQATEAIGKIRDEIGQWWEKQKPQAGEWYFVSHLGKVEMMEWHQEKGYAVIRCKNKVLRVSLEHFAHAKKIKP